MVFENKILWITCGLKREEREEWLRVLDTEMVVYWFE
jgi:hypothetical protein